MQLEKLLQQIGYSKNEAKVYLASLEFGLSSAQEIAVRAGLPRTTVYSVLQYLADKGVVAKTMVKGKTRFVAEPPERLISSLSELHKKVEASMPELQAIYNKKENKPKILFFEGEEAVQKVWDDASLENPEEILEWSADNYFKFDKYAADLGHVKKNINLKIKTKRIVGKDVHSDVDQNEKGADDLLNTAIVPREKFNPSVEVSIYNNKVAFVNFEEQMSVIIHNKPIADAMRQAYELSWAGAKIEEDKNKKHPADNDLKV